MINDKQIKNSKTGEQVKRWRLILGQYADEHLNANDNLGLYDKQIDQALDYLYQHEYRSRGLLMEDKNQSNSKYGGKESSVYNTDRKSVV